MKTKVTTRGQTSIPAKIRKEFKITDKTTLDWEIEDGKIVVYPIPENPLQALRGIAKDWDYSVEQFLKERNEERQRERERDRRKLGI
ncbi:MAG: AbrB/MazE/SpoVT family DNA-binding domain-containing protein [Candidatus Marinimicrobia bacterium]|nr:AbrB/MazE/SpoVT family DNA-binding domain-containing protein [Candidatus Neomarinimicrobiota bacterium]